MYESTHIIGDSVSCINLIFTSQPNLVMKSGVLSSLYENCHRQIVFVKFNLKVLYPSPYKQGVWHFNKANVDHIRKTISDFQGERSFAKMNINEMGFIF